MIRLHFVNLMSSGTIWMVACGCAFGGHFDYINWDGRPALTTGSTIPGGEVLHSINQKRPPEHTYSSSFVSWLWMQCTEFLQEVTLKSWSIGPWDALHLETELPQMWWVTVIPYQICIRIQHAGYLYKKDTDRHRRPWWHGFRDTDKPRRFKAWQPPQQKQGGLPPALSERL